MSEPTETSIPAQRDLSQPVEGFVRKYHPGQVQKERSLMAKVYCEVVTARYQDCLDANDFDYGKCKREEMHNFHCVANAYELVVVVWMLNWLELSDLPATAKRIVICSHSSHN